MPGIIGVVGRLEQPTLEQRLAALAQTVRYEDHYRVDLHCEAQVGLGRVSLGLINPAPQPVWNEERTICAVMEGEVYDYAAAKRRLVDAGHRFQTDSDAEFVLHLFEEDGDDFALQLNGAFTVALYDCRRRRLLIANDRMGLHPLYYALHNGVLSFAPKAHSLLVDPALPRTLDKLAVAELLTLDHPLHDHSFLQSVKLMPQAGLLEFQDGELSLRRYWTLKYADHYELCSEQEHVEEFVHVLTQAARRQMRDSLPAGMLLSGGLDSRVLLAAMRDGPASGPFHTFTWGVPGCDDARFAKMVSDRVGVTHHWFELKPDHLIANAERGVALTNGSNVVHYHSLATLPQQAAMVKVIYKGVFGDAIMGTALNRHFWADYAPQAVAAFHYRMHLDRGVLVFPIEQHAGLFTDSFQAELGNGIMEEYAAGMAEANSTQLGDQRCYFDLRQRIPRMTLNGVELVRSQVAVRTPYADNDFIDFSTRLPPGFRFERHIMKQALMERYPKVAQVPYTETGLPLRFCARDVAMRGERWLAWQLHRAGLRKSGVIAKRPYAYYDQWFRTVLRPWVEEVLLSPRALERGIFRPDAIRRLIAEQVGGAKHAVHLGALLGLELWQRRFLD